jgi:hypothetical protein
VLAPSLKITPSGRSLGISESPKVVSCPPDLRGPVLEPSTTIQDRTRRRSGVLCAGSELPGRKLQWVAAHWPCPETLPGIFWRKVPFLVAEG